MEKIGIICAIPRERRPILRCFPGATKSELAGFLSWSFPAGTNHVTLVESGMGAVNAAAATAAMVAAFRPTIVLSVGFCGAIRPGALVGDLVVATQQYTLTSGRLALEAGPDMGLCHGLLQGAAPLNYHCGTFISTDSFISKGDICPLIPDKLPTPVLEMESAAIVKVCRSAGLPAVAIRAVSDTAAEDPAPLALKLFSPNFSLSKKRVAAALLARPNLLPQLARLARNTSIAGNSLARALANALERLQ